MLLLPFCLQWSLGGYRASSAVSIWAFASPLGALMFSGIRRSRPWFAGFVALTAVSAVLDPVLSAHAARIPSTIATIMFVLNIVGVMGTSFLLLLYFVGERERIAAALAVEREKSDRLLLNTLPAPIAARLKESPATIADGFEGVTVLFADIVGFTELASELEPGEVVALLDGLFSTFDRLADRHGLEKIKTIGDAYMVAGGLPVYRADHTEAVVEMGLDMVDAVSGLAGQIDVPLSVRIGIDCGPVVAGVIGRRKFIYDLWGDTVNTASRMESHGVAGSIQVTPRVFEKLKDRYQFSAREPMPIKGKGVMAPYLVVGRTAVSAASVLLDKERSVQPVPLT